MATAGDGKVEQGNTQAIVRGLTRQLQQRHGASGPSACISPSSSSQSSASRTGVLEKLQAVTEAKLTNSDVRSRGRSLQSGNSSSSDSGVICGELPTESGLTTSKNTMPQQPASSSAARIAKALSVPTTAAKKPKRRRKSKKIMPKILQVEAGDFLQTVRKLTAGTYGSHSDFTATPLVSQPSATRNALEPLPSRPPTKLPAAAPAPVVASIPPVGLEPATDLLGLLFQSSECSLLNEMMGYENQSSCNAMASTFSAAESVEGYGSKASQFAGVYSSEEVVEGSSASFSFNLAEQMDRRKTPSATEPFKHAGAHIPFEDIDAWLL